MNTSETRTFTLWEAFIIMVFHRSLRLKYIINDNSTEEKQEVYSFFFKKRLRKSVQKLLHKDSEFNTLLAGLFLVFCCFSF